MYIISFEGRDGSDNKNGRNHVKYVGTLGLRKYWVASQTFLCSVVLL